MVAKYNKKIVERICKLLQSDNFTVLEICKIVGIAEDTYYDWKNKHAEFSDAIKKARDTFDETIVHEAKNSLRKKVNGYDFDEKKTTYINDKEGKPKIKEQTTIKKHYQPDTAAIIFTLTNKAPEEFKNKYFNEMTGKNGKDLFSSISDEELDAKIQALEGKLSK